MHGLRHPISGFVTISALAVVAALAAVTLGISPAQAHTTTGTLFPNGAGTYGAWANGEDQIDETAAPDCAPAESINTGTTGARESVQISLDDVPVGAFITSVNIQSWHRASGGLGGTFQTFARLDSTDIDSGTNVGTTSASGCTNTETQVITVGTTMAEDTTLEIGVVKTAADADTVRIGALRATVTYDLPPSAPTLVSPADGATTTDRTPTFDWDASTDPDDASGIGYLIVIAPLDGENCDWDNATSNPVTSTEFTPVDPLGFGTYCWRVVPRDHGDFLPGEDSAERTITIEPPAVTAEITAADKEYDGTTDATYTCDVVGEDADDDVTCDGDPATFESAGAGTGKTVTATGLTLGGADAGSYELTNTSDTDTADISKATLSVDADDKSKAFGEADPTLTYTLTGFVNGEDAMSATITGAGDCTRAPGESVADSPYEITCAPGTLVATNYDFETGESGEFTINAATLSVNAENQTKDYGDDDPTFTYTLTGFADGEDKDTAGVTGDAACDREAGETVAGSPYTITCEPGSLAAANYTFETGTTGELTIEGAEVSAEITAADKDYDGTTDAEYTCEVVDAQSGDDVECDGDDPATFDDANAGTDKTVTATNLFLSGDDAGNYTLTNTEDTDEANIAKVTLAIDADDASKDYGDDDPTFLYSLSGFVNGEDESTAAGLDGSPNCTRDPGETVIGSPYEITCAPGTLVADNYDFEPGETGDFTINAATLSVNAENQTKTYGDADPTFTYTLTGFADGEDKDSASVTGDAACDREAGETVAEGPYTITCLPGTLAADNYTFATGATGELTIEGAGVEAVITASDKPYDGLVDAEYTCDVEGEASGDNVTCDGDHPAMFDDANAGTDKTVTATNLALSGDDAGNYTLTNTEDTDEANIEAATLAVNADDKTKEFGDDDPVLTYTLTGFIAPDDAESVTITGAGECTRAPGETVAGSPYVITCTPGNLDADNYTFVTGEDGELMITPDTTVPSVTINQALSQDDPTTDSPIVFDVEFSEDVTGFEDDDVELSGSAGATTAEVTGDGPEYTVAVSGMTSNGDVIADVKAAAATDGSNDSTASTSDDNTVEYNLKEFDPGPTATISGTPRVGETLTAGEGSPLPAPDSFEYEWFADGDPIAGADDQTFTPTSAEVGKAITVTVTAVKAGYADASDTSDPTSPVGTLGPKTLLVKAQPVAFAGDRITIRVARLAPREDYTLRFDGEVIKTGKANAGGSFAITFLLPLSTQPGDYTVTAIGSLPDRQGTDTQVVRAPLTLGVTLTKPSVPAGGTQRVQVRNLLHGESVEIRYDGTLVSPSNAEGNSSGGYSLTFPVGTTAGSHTVEVKGLYDDRTTTKTFTVTSP